MWPFFQTEQTKTVLIENKNKTLSKFSFRVTHKLLSPLPYPALCPANKVSLQFCDYLLSILCVQALL